MRPQILYPTLVILLIVITMVGSISVLFVARADGGAQVVEDYYQRTVNWNNEMAQDAASAKLGWQISVSPLQYEAKGTRIAFAVSDAKQQPISQLEGSVVITLPQQSKPLGSFSIDKKGTSYSVFVPHTLDGLTDLTFHLKQGTAIFRQIKRVNGE